MRHVNICQTNREKMEHKIADKLLYQVTKNKSTCLDARHTKES